MSVVRPVVAGMVALVTRRTVGRQFLLRPDRGLGAAFGYVLAVVAARHGVAIAAGVAMANHTHVVVWDREGRLPAFTRDLHRLWAVVVNAWRGRRGEVWDGEPPHVLELADGETAAEACAYVLANPVKAGLVRRGREWPGFRTTANAIGREEAFARPARVFAAEGAMPARAVLRLEAPWGERRFAELVAVRVAEKERRAREALREAGRGWVGVWRVLATPWREAAARPEGRGRGPVVAARDAVVRAARLAARWAFRVAYGAALARYRAGEREVEFPYGTWAMRVLLGVRCGRAPP